MKALANMLNEEIKEKLIELDKELEKMTTERMLLDFDENPARYDELCTEIARGQGKRAAYLQVLSWIAQEEYEIAKHNEGINRANKQANSW